MPNEPSVEEIVTKLERNFRDWEGEPAPVEWWILTRDLRLVIADWRKRGEARDVLEKELDVLSASHEALKAARPQGVYDQLAYAVHQHAHADVLAWIDAALPPKP